MPRPEFRQWSAPKEQAKAKPATRRKAPATAKKTTTKAAPKRTTPKATAKVTPKRTPPPATVEAPRFAPGFTAEEKP